MTHLRLVPPPKPPFPFEVEMFSFARVGQDIFLYHNGRWELATHNSEARDALTPYGLGP